MLKVGVIYFSDNELHCMDVGYGVSALKRITNDVEIFRIQNNKYEELTKYNKDVVVIFLSYNSYDLLVETSYVIKNSFPTTKIIVCGPLATQLYKEILQKIKYVDVVAIGEYEETLYEFCSLISEKGNYKECNGIAFLKDNQVVQTGHRKLLNVDDICYPARELNSEYGRYFHIYGTRGCEGNCTFCDRNSLYKNSEGNVLRTRSVSNIVDEIDYLVDKYNCKFISFSDPTFCSSNDAIHRLRQLYTKLKEKSYWVQFSINMRAELINHDVVRCLQDLSEVGLGKVFIGIESFNNDELRLFGKKASINEIRECIAALKQFEYSNKDEYRIKIEYGFINFQPYSSVNSVIKNIEELKSLGINISPYIISSKLTLNALAPLSKKVVRDGLIISDGEFGTLKYYMQYSFPYMFLNKEINIIFDLVKKVVNRISVHNDNGLEFIRNRYYHFYGSDEVLEKYDNAYEEWLEEIDLFSYTIFKYIVNNYCEIDIEKRLYQLTDVYKKKIDMKERILKSIQKRVLIQLMKKDEVIYYRSVF